MSVARRFGADAGARFDPAPADALVTLREGAPRIQEEFRVAVPADALKDATAA